ncbi:MAG: GNAT superfamily N-acetyltransferase [Alphaproteobacteria bacterium]|jgi:GNAT superfamily N-acetyltransferase
MPKKTFTIRAAKEADIADIAAIHRRSITLLGHNHYTADELESWAAGLDPAFYRNALQTADLFEIAQATDGTILAMGATRGNEVWLLYTDPDHAGQGIGGALLARDEADIAAHGHDMLTVCASLNAESFYAHRSYRPMVYSGHKTRGGLILNAMTMEKCVKP